MATRKTGSGGPGSTSTVRHRPEKAGRKFCDMPEMAARVLAPDVDPRRAAFVLRVADMWVNGTVIHYCFFDHRRHGSPERWTGRAADRRQRVGMHDAW